MYNFRLNDPANPIYINYPSLPQVNNLKFKIQSKIKFEKESQDLNCYILISETLNFINSLKALPNRWARTENLNVVPRAGKKLNACYDKVSLKFFYDINPNTKKYIYTVDSTDAIAHELGHAILDTIRPDFWNPQMIEIWSLHETMADITALISMLIHTSAIELAIQETNGNLRNSNIITKIAEEIGSVANFHAKSHSPDFLRDASIKYYYHNPKNLPKKTSPDKLASAPHSFCRIFTSAWYECFVRIYEIEVKNMSPLDAVIKSRNYMTKNLFISICKTPRVPNAMEALAKVMIAESEEYKDVLIDVFKEWKLYSEPTVQALSLDVSKTETKFIHLSEILLTSLSIKEDPLLEVPLDTYVADGEVIQSSYDEAIDAIEFCVNNYIIDQIDDSWTIENGKLERSYIS